VAISIVIGSSDVPGSRRRCDPEAIVVARALEKKEQTNTTGGPLGERRRDCGDGHDGQGVSSVGLARPNRGGRCGGGELQGS